MIARTPEPPYYAVIFSSTRTEGDHGYAAMSYWKHHAEHSIARQKGRQEWYKSFKVRISRVERDYEFKKS